MTFTVSFPSVTLSIDEVWPDGGAPENPTAEDVAARMQEDGGFHRVVRDWNLLSELDVDGVIVR